MRSGPPQATHECRTKPRQHNEDQDEQRCRRNDEKPDVRLKRKKIDVSQVPDVRQRLVLLQHDIESQIHRRMAHQRNARLARSLVHRAVSRQ